MKETPKSHALSSQQPSAGITAIPTGSPFVPGLPLESHQEIFGRKDVFHFLAQELNGFKSVNIVGERRMGKSSVLNHLLGRQDEFVVRQNSQPPIALIRVDLQSPLSKAEYFYGSALRDLIERLPAPYSNLAQSLDPLKRQLQEDPSVSAIKFENVLRQIAEAEDGRVRPVLLVDEFERLFDEKVKDGFPFPDFFDGLRAQITARRLAMAIFSRQGLTEYFLEPDRRSLTSTFPSYFQPFTLKELSEEDADALLLQKSDHQLELHESREGRKWAGAHPCWLQCAGDAWYQAKSQGHTAKWARNRYREIVVNHGFVNPAHTKTLSVTGLLYRIRHPDKLIGAFFRAILTALRKIGGLFDFIGHKFDDMKKTAIGFLIVVIVILLAYGYLNPHTIWGWLAEKLELIKGK